MAVRCLIVDDNPRFLAAARELLECEQISVVGVASTIEEALRRFDELRPDVTLVDISLGGEPGFELARRLVDARPGGRPVVILISTYAERDFSDMIATCPAVAFLSKSRLSGNAIRAILGGQAQNRPA
ncbi:response regulator [Sphaerisporangium krabiense]|uniref:DNA-binding NarL/FixJ family response regulator n=1 Tax=Sphaerisporangium krabiense TaxID=763782 RepID=A0A7W9DTV5_9ACTN|nr:response regulator transcription factor [Sphaerisporangium krabiense]MBB5629830.1 DNA-binding NarL/FixJ family response regulator [Sphaerisporangium krabiense]GII63930.1 response regulator [Sphaerisporangium krabiense]